MPPIRIFRFAMPALLAAVCFMPLPASAQRQDYGTIFFKSNVGSFKFLGVNGLPAEGRVQISFTGTLLVNSVSGTDPKITTSGAIRREYNDPVHLQQAFHGTGSMVIDGKFTSIQWFGRDLNAQWHGFGVARLVGEFDKDLNTGQYWYINNPADIHEWGTQLHAITNPPQIGDYIVVPQKRGG
jgi:hypothetical protein